MCVLWPSGPLLSIGRVVLNCSHGKSSNPLCLSLFRLVKAMSALFILHILAFIFHESRKSSYLLGSHYTYVRSLEKLRTGSEC